MSCGQNSSQADKDYIKSLEEKNKVLEKELQELKGKAESGNIAQGKEKTRDYFTMASTKDEVVEVMGEPTTYIITAPEAFKLLYGTSTVFFYKGKVISYDNLGGNLKVRLKK